VTAGLTGDQAARSPVLFSKLKAGAERGGGRTQFGGDEQFLPFQGSLVDQLADSGDGFGSVMVPLCLDSVFFFQ
jgi:hypothetical protein